MKLDFTDWLDQNRQGLDPDNDFEYWQAYQEWLKMRLRESGGIELFVGGHAGTLPSRDGGRERDSLTGKRMFTAVHPPNFAGFSNPAKVQGIIDSGAFSIDPRKRPASDKALERQLNWESKASDKWGEAWQAYGLVSNDILIDETWSSGERKKQRWSIKEADWAVRETVEAAQYLASQRERLVPRRLVLSVQGVDSIQYQECMAEVLRVATPDDIIGFGGWCILGRFTSWLPEFWRTLRLTFPMIVQKGCQDIHIFGVLYQPALGGMLYLADQYGLKVSTDSTAPIKACLWKCEDKTTEAYRKKAGTRVKSGYWLDNCNWWQNTLTNLRQSEYYKEPPNLESCRQLDLFAEMPSPKQLRSGCPEAPSVGMQAKQARLQAREVL
jgi:hypothetical protein